MQTPTAQVSNPWQNQQQSSLQQQPSHDQQQHPQQPNYQQQQTHQQTAFQQQSYQQPNYQAYHESGNQQSANPFDKNSILSLYNYPQPALQQSGQSQALAAAPPATTSVATASGSMNPFASSQNLPQGQSLSAAQTPGVRHVSNESVDFAGLMGGRHSPDAFSGLSASFRR
jgi:hypothetical protein